MDSECVPWCPRAVLSRSASSVLEPQGALREPKRGSYLSPEPRGYLKRVLLVVLFVVVIEVSLVFEFFGRVSKDLRPAVPHSRIHSVQSSSDCLWAHSEDQKGAHPCRLNLGDTSNELF